MAQESNSGVPAPPFAHVVVDPGSPVEATLPLTDRLFVGRECAGVDESHRIVLAEDLAVSRNHLELRVDPERSVVVVVDTSSNGSRVNGIRIERSVGVPLSDGDSIQLGDHVLKLRMATEPTRPVRAAPPRETVSVASPTTMALLVGDLINFSTVSEYADHHVLARDIDHIYAELRQLLGQFRGTLVDYVGDAFFAGWELDVDPAAPVHALQFALAAAEMVSEITAHIELRHADGSPLKMGWGASMGSVVMQLMPGAVLMVLGDATNVAFRISAIANREGRPAIIATDAMRNAAGGSFAFGDPETVMVKGRVTAETIYGVSAL
ncbi:MAG: adenylate/guanylate cyclase domain-containing protein [Acidimicrobiales bacterium]